MSISISSPSLTKASGPPAALSGAASTADFATDPALTSGTTAVTLTASTGFGVPANRGGSVDGTPPGYSYQHLYEDLLIATSATVSTSKLPDTLEECAQCGNARALRTKRTWEWWSKRTLGAKVAEQKARNERLMEKLIVQQ